MSPAKLRELLAAAEPNGPPWSIRHDGLIEDGHSGDSYSAESIEARTALIVASVNALPRLLDVVEAANGVMDSHADGSNLVRLGAALSALEAAK